MVEVVAIVEGQTEQTFVHEVLAAHLGLRRIAIWAVLPGKARKSGGVKSWESAQGDILRAIKQGPHVTTMFDFYGMPLSWPGRTEAAKLPWGQRGSHVEHAMEQSIAAVVGGSFDPRQLIPYVQVHEFEALAFADVAVLAEMAALLFGVSAPGLQEKLREIVQQFDGPEEINDDYETCPSRRLTGLLERYRKSSHGPAIVAAIGLPKLRQACRHFNDWLTRLEALAS
jgi:hypothetical protein